MGWSCWSGEGPGESVASVLNRADWGQRDMGGVQMIGESLEGMNICPAEVSGRKRGRRRGRVDGPYRITYMKMEKNGGSLSEDLVVVEGYRVDMSETKRV